MSKMLINLKKMSGYSQLRTRCSQGILGTCIFNKMKCIWKVSKYIDYTCEAESETSQTIQESKLGILPHFVKVVECFDIFLSSAQVPRKCMFMEEIKGCQISDLIKNCGDSPDLKSVMGQTFLTIAAAYDMIGFTHYDLHADNVLVKKTDADIHLYKFPDGGIYQIETHNLCPVIIDYGFSYVDSRKKLLPSCYPVDTGNTVYEKDDNVDCRTFICSTMTDLKDKMTKPTPLTKKLRSYVKLIPCRGSTGWINRFEKTIARMRKELKPFPEFRATSIFKSELDAVVDIIQALVSLPLEPVDDKDFNIHYLEFYKQWLLIEEVVGNTWLELVVLKNLVTAINQGKTGKALRNKMEIMSFSFEDTSIDYDKLADNLKGMSHRIQRIMYNASVKNNEIKQLTYKKLSPLQIYNEVFNIPITFKDNQLVHVFDLMNGEEKTFKLDSEMVLELNDGSKKLVDFTE
jgi:hypothetical protein